MVITESGVEFSYLDLNDVESLESAIRAEATKGFKDKVTEFKLPPAEAFEQWQKFRPDLVVSNQVYRFVRFTRDGAVRALTESLKKSGVASESIAKIVASYDLENAGNLAAALIGFEDRIPVGRMAKATENPTDPTSSERSATS